MFRSIWNRSSHTLDILVLVILCSTVFLLSYTCGPALDTWYHIKLGEVFLQKGLLYHDVFSFSAFNRPTIPYEWLFQVLIYSTQKLFGIASLGIFVGIFSVIQIVLFYIILRKIFSVHPFSAFLLSFFYFATITNFLIQRPTVVANVFFVLIIFLVFLYIYKQKNYLWIGIPLMLVWTNLHASFILGIGVTAMYATVCFVLSLMTKENNWRHRSLVLLGYTGLFLLISVLPPLHGLQYTTYLQYAMYHNNLTNIIEWLPLFSSNIVSFWIYTGFVALVSLFIFVCYRKNIQTLILLSPLMFLMLIPYMANRNILYGMFAVMLLFGYLLSTLEQQHAKKNKRYVISSVIGLSLMCIGYIAYLQPFSYFANTEHYPVKAADFILSQQIKGNMFNNYKYGGYLLYRLYPQQKVFIDGRGDMYLCCELPRLNTLTTLDMQNNTQGFASSFTKLTQDYDISFVLTTRAPGIDTRLTKLLSQDPHWSLVFWDDAAQIFVKDNGINTSLIQKYGATAATPYGVSPYASTDMEKAKQEYLRMISISDSAISRNNVGLIDVKEKNVSDAEAQFTRAIQLEPDYFPPYINMALLDIQSKNFDDAKALLTKAISVDPKNPITYVYLGQIYAKIDQDINQAKSIWQQGVDSVTDPQAQAELQQLINGN